MSREWTLPLPFTKPPLSLNDSPTISRGGRMARMTTVRNVRRAGADLAKAHRVPRLERWTAVLHYQPRDNRKRDAENLIATLKPLVDGLVDAHVSAGDDTRHYALTEPVIHAARKGEPGRMWLVVVDLGHLPGTQAALDLTTEGHHA